MQNIKFLHSRGEQVIKRNGNQFKSKNKNKFYSLEFL